MDLKLAPPDYGTARLIRLRRMQDMLNAQSLPPAEAAHKWERLAERYREIGALCNQARCLGKAAYYMSLMFEICP